MQSTSLPNDLRSWKFVESNIYLDQRLPIPDQMTGGDRLSCQGLVPQDQPSYSSMSHRNDEEALSLVQALIQTEALLLWRQNVESEVQSVNELVSLEPHDRLTGPIQFVAKLLETWKLSPNDAGPLLGFDKSDEAAVKELLCGRAALSGRDVKDRIASLFEIRKTLSASFRDESVENEWLREPQEMLNGKIPMDLLLEGSMENLLLVRDYVNVAAGH